MRAISSDEIISIIKEEISNYDEVSRNQEVGTVVSVGDGIATIYGLDHAMYGEIITLENGLKGMVQDIKQNASCSEMTAGSHRERRLPVQRGAREFR